MMWRHVAVGMVVLAAACGGVRAEGWGQDFARQPVAARPQLETRYTDGSRAAFEVVAAAYHVVGELRAPHRLLDAATGDPWLSFTVTSEDGTVYASERAKPDSRINLYRRGPYFCEVRWLDVQVADDKGKLAPLKGDLALYCYPEKMLASITWHALTDFPAAAVGVMGLVNETFTPAFFTAKSQQTFAFPVFGETPALPDGAFEDLESVAPMRYDVVRGCYTIGSLSTGGFQGHFYEHPNRYETARFRVRNDETPRTIYVCQENTGGDKGSVEGGVLLDESGNPLPIVVQISKNFAGEKEEKLYNPADTAFSETYFPLVLEPGETRGVTSLHLYQNWGSHMVKQFSSLGAWMDYFHSSTGVTETTCYVPFKFGGLPGVDIADFRAMSQYAFWGGQPQHDNLAGHSFLSFNDGADWRYLEYRGTTYRSTGPNWMDIGFEYLSTDRAIHATVDSFELPQADELRQFVHLRYDVVAPVTIPHAREDFRLLTAASWVQRLRQTHFAATGLDTMALSFKDDHFAVTACPVPDENSYLAVYGDAKGGNAFIVRHWEARVGGQAVGPAANVWCEKSGDTRLLLTTDADALSLQPGDYFDVEAILMPFGATTSAAEAQRETVAYGSEAPRVTRVARGRKECDFPTIVRAEKNRAEFTIQGGRDVVPVIVTGLDDYRWPRLYREGAEGWQPVSMARVGDQDGVQTFCAPDGTFGVVFLVTSDNTPQSLRATVGKAPVSENKIRVTAYAPPPNAPPELAMQHMALIEAPWMDRPIQLRYPETMQTDALDFIDHQREDMPPRVDPLELAKVWNVSEGDSLWFQWTFDNESAGGRLSPNADSVDLEFWVQNNREQPVSVALQFCPLLTGTLFEDRALERTWGLFDGEWRRLCMKDRGKGMSELCHYRVKGTPDFEVPLPWGKSEDLLDIGMVAVTSQNRKYVFAIAWPDCSRVLSNADNPCIHSDPSDYPAPPGVRVVTRGKVYLIEGDLDDLLARYNREIVPLSRGMSHAEAQTSDAGTPTKTVPARKNPRVPRLLRIR